MKAQKQTKAAATPKAKAKATPKTAVEKKPTATPDAKAKGGKPKAKAKATPNAAALRKAAAAFLAEAAYHTKHDIAQAQTYATEEKRAYEFGFLITADLEGRTLKLRNVSCDYVAKEVLQFPDEEWTLEGAINTL